MTAPIDTQLREYTEFFDDQLVEVTVDDILTRSLGDGVVRPLQPRRLAVAKRWVAAAAAAVVVAVIVGGIAILIRAGGDGAPVDPQPGPTQAPAPEQTEPTTAPDPTTPTTTPSVTDPPPSPTVAPDETVTPTTSTPPVTDPPPASDIPPGTTSALDVIGSGTVETAVGDLAWTKLGLLDSGISVPGSLMETPLIATDDGLASWDAATGTLWSSSDGVSWTAGNLPVPVRPDSVRVIPGASWTWIHTSDPRTLWRSSDLEAWQQIDLSLLVPPDSFGLVWERRIGRPAELGSDSWVTWSVAPRLPLDEIFAGQFRAGRELALWPSFDGPGSFDVYAFDEESDSVIAVIRFESDPSGGRVVDVETGEVLHRFGLDGAALEIGPLGLEDFVVDSIAVIGFDGVARPAQAPWEDRHSSASLFSVNGSLIAFAEYNFADDRNGMDSWVTEDGAAWRFLGGPEFLPEGTDGIARVEQHGGHLTADVFPPHEGERWVSSDGLAWERLPAPEDFPSIVTVPYRGGYAAFAGATLWVSGDGSTWERFNTGTFEVGAGQGRFDGGFGLRSIGDRLIMVSWSDEAEGVDQMFIFEPAP